MLYSCDLKLALRTRNITDITQGVHFFLTGGRLVAEWKAFNAPRVRLFARKLPLQLGTEEILICESVMFNVKSM